MWNRASLRTRITLFSALIIILVGGFLTGAFLHNAGDGFQPTIQQEGEVTGSDATIDLYRTASDPDNPRGLGKDFILRSLTYLAIAVFAGVAGAWFLARRTLRPISELSQRIESIDVNNLSEPIPVPKSEDEVARLTRSFNNMLHKLNSAFEGQKRFVQNAAHELKTPVTAILTNIEVLEMDEKPSQEDYKVVIKTVKENAERMSTLVQDLLLINVESRELFTRFSFRQLLEEIREELAQESEQRGISFAVRGDLELTGNRALLKRAFHNIVHNAIRYNRPGGSIDISCGDGQITIADTGIGIPSDKLDKIFEPFYCVDASRSRKLGGSGLGLAMVKQIFQQHQIQVQVSSVEAQGTRFTISLPT